MHWVIVRLLRLVPEAGMATRAIEQLDALITPEGMEREHAFFLDPDLGNFKRPGWLVLILTAEAARLVSPQGDELDNVAPASRGKLEAKFLRWLPKLTYPQRMGMHPNTAFALTLALSWANLRADEGDASLRDAIEMAAMRYFLRDTDYPAHYEPSGADFLSPALTEAVLMRRALELDDFLPWLNGFLTGLPAEPRSILIPADVSDPTDGQIAHLHGLNLSRAWGWMVLSEALDGDDPRRAPMIESAQRHAAASMPFVVGSDYAVEHWLAVYATLLLTFDQAGEVR